MKKEVFVVGYDPIDDQSGVGGFDWFYSRKDAMDKLVSHCQENTHFVWFRVHNVEVSTDDLKLNQNIITKNVQENIIDNGADGDWDSFEYFPYFPIS